jgi:hypothetical protein
VACLLKARIVKSEKTAVAANMVIATQCHTRTAHNNIRNVGSHVFCSFCAEALYDEDQLQLPPGLVPQGFYPLMTVLARANSSCEKQTHPHFRSNAPHQHSTTV